MNFFKMPKPRRFSYRPIYTDEREERLRRLEERAGERKSSEDGRRQADDGAPDAEEAPSAGYGIRFSRPKEKTAGSLLTMNTMQIIVIIVVLVAVWRILLSL